MSQRDRDPEPRIANEDHKGAIICMQSKRQLRAVRLLHGGGYIDPETLGCYDKVSEVQALMRAGPIFHLGPERHGFSWSRPHNRHNEDYLISLSKHRKDVPAESWVYSNAEEMTQHARDMWIDHAYIWERDDNEPAGPGWWHYMKTQPPEQILIPYDRQVKEALSALETILHAGPPIWDFTETLPYSTPPPIEGSRHRIWFDTFGRGDLTLAILDNGAIFALVPQVKNPGTDPGEYGRIPLTDEEQAELAARIEDTYPPGCPVPETEGRERNRKRR